MDQIEAQMHHQQQQSQHQAQTHLDIGHMVPMPMAHVPAPELTIAQPHPTHAHLQPVHPTFTHQVYDSPPRSPSPVPFQTVHPIFTHHLIATPPPRSPSPMHVETIHASPPRSPSPAHSDPNDLIHPQVQRTATPPDPQAHQYSNPHAHSQQYRFTHNNSPGGAISVPSDDDLNEQSSAAAASSSSAPAASSSAAAAAPAKAKAKQPVHSLSGTPPKPHANIPKYKLEAELANAYAKGLITDPEDKKEYEKIIEDKDYRKTGGYNRDTSGITKNTLIDIYRRIYPKIKDR